MLDRGVPPVVNRVSGIGATVNLIRKDPGLIHQMVESLGVPLATGDEVPRVLARAADAGYGNDDMTAIIPPVDEIARAGLSDPALRIMWPRVGAAANRPRGRVQRGEKKRPTPRCFSPDGTFYP